MNTAIVVAGLAPALGAVLVRDVWRGRARAARTLLVICGGADVLVGLVPVDVDDNLHLLGALLIMGGGNLVLLIGAASARLRLLTAASDLVAIAAGVLFFLQIDPGIGLGGMERVAVFALQVWVVVVAVDVLTRRGRHPRGAVGSGGSRRPRAGEPGPTFDPVGRAPKEQFLPGISQAPGPRGRDASGK